MDFLMVDDMPLEVAKVCSFQLLHLRLYVRRPL